MEGGKIVTHVTFMVRFQSSEPKPTQLPTAYIGIVYSLLIDISMLLRFWQDTLMQTNTLHTHILDNQSVNQPINQYINLN